MDPMTLQDDPFEALHEIASYLGSLSKSSDRAVRPNGEEIEGYWQTDEWLSGLEEIASECARIIKLHEPPPRSEPNPTDMFAR